MLAPLFHLEVLAGFADSSERAMPRQLESASKNVTGTELPLAVLHPSSFLILRSGCWSPRFSVSSFGNQTMKRRQTRPASSLRPSRLRGESSGVTSSFIVHRSSFHLPLLA